jgi:uncharacterized protein (TIGR00266 family)
MQLSVRHGPSFGVARCLLAPYESIQVESGAMMAMSPNLHLAARAEGGVLKSLKRATLGGESLFVSTYTAPAEGGFVDLAPRLPGDITTYALTDAMPLFIGKGGWLANEATVRLDTQWGGFKNLFGSEGGFLVRAEGRGTVVFTCYGALEKWTLGPRDQVTVDSGHMVAYEASVSLNLRKATAGVVQTLKTGEGFVFDFQGPGTVWVQTRNPNELLGWIAAALPASTRA